MNNVRVIAEIFWLLTAIGSLVMGIIATLNHGIKNSYPFFIILFFSVIIYLARRNLRIKESEKE